MRINTFCGEICHIWLRGVNKQDVFLDHQDYQRFSDLLIYCNRSDSRQFSDFIRGNKTKITKILKEEKEDLVKTIIRTLMKNHFHTSVISLGDGFIGKYMQKVLDSYTKYFNNKYKRKGYLFEQKYQYRRIKDYTDLLNVIDYIYHNPLKILDPKYKHIDLLIGKYKITKKQKEYLKGYKYTHKGPIFNKYKKQFKLDY